MKSIVLLIAIAAAMPAVAEIQGRPSARDLMAAINAADASLVPYRKGSIAEADIRAVRCVANDEEPTEFECTWRQRVHRAWIARKTWLIIDGGGWRVADG